MKAKEKWYFPDNMTVATIKTHTHTHHIHYIQKSYTRKRRNQPAVDIQLLHNLNVSYHSN